MLMPLQPDISLQARPAQVQPYDPTQTLLTVAQLRNLQNQADLRGLQMADLQQGLAEYQRVRGVLNDQGATPRAPMRSQLATGGMVAPAPGEGPGVPASMPTPGGGDLYSQLSPATQAEYRQIAPPPGPMAPQAQPGLPPGAMPPGGPPPQAPPSGPPQGPQGTAPPQARQAQAQQGQGFVVPSMDQLQQRSDFYRRLAGAGPKYGAPLAKEMMTLDLQDLDLRLKSQEGQLKGLQATNEALSSVRSQGDLDEALQVLRALSSPFANQIGTDYADPRTRAAIEYYGAHAQSLQQRVQATLDNNRNNIEAFKENTGRMKEEREGREVTVVPTQTGNVLQYKYLPSGGGPGTSVQPGIGGGAAVSPDIYRNQTERLRLGEVGTYEGPEQAYLYPKNPAAQAFLPGAQPGAQGGQPGLTSLGPSKQAMEPLRETGKEYLKNATTAATAAQETKVLLAKARQYIDDGILERSVISNAELEAFERANIVPPRWAGPNERKFVNTVRLMQIGQALPLAQQGNRIAAGMSEYEQKMLERATGNLMRPSNVLVAREAIAQMDELADNKLTRANQALDQARRGESPLPTFQAPAVSAFAPATRPGRQRPQAQQKVNPAIPPAVYKQWVDELTAQGMSKQDIDAKIRASGYRIGP